MTSPDPGGNGPAADRRGHGGTPPAGSWLLAGSGTGRSPGPLAIGVGAAALLVAVVSAWAGLQGASPESRSEATTTTAPQLPPAPADRSGSPDAPERSATPPTSGPAEGDPPAEAGATLPPSLHPVPPSDRTPVRIAWPTASDTPGAAASGSRGVLPGGPTDRPSPSSPAAAGQVPAPPAEDPGAPTGAHRHDGPGDDDQDGRQQEDDRQSDEQAGDGDRHQPAGDQQRADHPGDDEQAGHPNPG